MPSKLILSKLEDHQAAVKANAKEASRMSNKTKQVMSPQVMRSNPLARGAAVQFGWGEAEALPSEDQDGIKVSRNRVGVSRQSSSSELEAPWSEAELDLVVELAKRFPERDANTGVRTKANARYTAMKAAFVARVGPEGRNPGRSELQRQVKFLRDANRIIVTMEM